MTANVPSSGNELPEFAAEWLRQHLPAGWNVAPAARTQPGSDGGAVTVSGGIDVRAPNGTTATIAVEARRSLAPRDAEQLVSGLAQVLRSLSWNIPILVVAPWLSERTQERLASQGINFLDRTGNALVRLDNPALYIRCTGAARSPRPASRGEVRLRGPKAGRLVRLLADVRPPYAVLELARAADVAPGYVSRVLDALDRDALIERSRRGRVEDVDVAALLRRWADTYDVFRANNARVFVSPNGPDQALATLAGTDRVGRVAVTGSFGAVRLAPVSAPTLLSVFSDDIDATSQELGLLPAAQRGDVALLEPFDRIVWTGTTTDAGIKYAAVSQIAVDCLTGPGRMPAEGEALLAWMSEHDQAWRLPSLAHAAIGRSA